MVRSYSKVHDFCGEITKNNHPMNSNRPLHRISYSLCWDDANEQCRFKIDRSYQQKIAGYDNRLKQIDTYFPIVTELLPIAEQRREVGFTKELTRQIVSLQPVEFKGRLYSKEYKEKFRTEHSTATIERNPQEKGKFRLCIDGMPILE